MSVTSGGEDGCDCLPLYTSTLLLVCVSQNVPIRLIVNRSYLGTSYRWKNVHTIGKIIFSLPTILYLHGFFLLFRFLSLNILMKHIKHQDSCQKTHINVIRLISNNDHVFFRFNNAYNISVLGSYD